MTAFPTAHAPTLRLYRVFRMEHKTSNRNAQIQFRVPCDVGARSSSEACVAFTTEGASNPYMLTLEDARKSWKVHISKGWKFVEWEFMLE